MGPPPKRKAPEKAAHKSNRVAAAFSQIRQKQKQAENPFDRFSNAKKKHEVVNRRVKGEDRNVGRARGKVRAPHALSAIVVVVIYIHSCAAGG